MKKSLVTLLAASCLLPACNQKAQDIPAAPESTAPVAAAAPRPFSLLLAFSQFQQVGEKLTPGPAKLVLLHRDVRSWRPETVLDEESLVFHKAYCRQDNSGRPEVVTIGASGAILKSWQRDENGRLQGRKLYENSFGGKWDRLRDIEEGDLNGDGLVEQIIVTHDQGVIVEGRQQENSWQYREIWRQPHTFIHEVEIGDLDGDKKLEFYATPSDPNKMNVSQDGQVIQGRYNPQSGTYDIASLQQFKNRHAKEILTHDFDGDGRDELYVSLEAQLDGAGNELKPLEILQIVQDGAGQLQSRTIAVLAGRQARVLAPAYLEGPTAPAKLLVTTLNGGVLVLTPNGQEPWPAQIVDGASQGFEHAALAVDSDGDGRDEIFVVADKQGTVSQYIYKNNQYYKRVIMRIDAKDIVWNITACHDGNNL